MPNRHYPNPFGPKPREQARAIAQSHGTDAVSVNMLADNIDAALLAAYQQGARDMRAAARRWLNDEADACLRDRVPGDEVGSKQAEVRTGVLIDAAEHIAALPLSDTEPDSISGFAAGIAAAAKVVGEFEFDNSSDDNFEVQLDRAIRAIPLPKGD